LRDEYDPTKLYDTSNGNRTSANVLGIRPDGRVAHNGMDHWWDDQGTGNCWERNTSSREGGPTDNFLVDPGRCADGGSVFTPGTSAVKDAGFLSCSQYDRNDPTWRHPPECSWFDSPERPTEDGPSGPLELTAAGGAGGSSGGAAAGVAATGAVVASGFALLAGLAVLRRRTLGTVG
jgi:hypothetical protein